MKILLVGPSWVGDMVMAQSLVAALHQRHDPLNVDVLAPEWTFPLLERMPGVSRALSMPVGHGSLQLRVRRELGRRLRREGYDQAIVLPNSLKSALVPWFAGIPLRTGWRGEMRYGLLNDCRRLDKQALPLMVQRFVALAVPASEPLSSWHDPVLRPCNEDDLSPLLEKLGLDMQQPVLVLCPGAEYGPSKQWPVEYFAAVAAQAVSEGRQVWIVGSENDRPVASAIAAQTGVPERVHMLAGQTSLGEVIDLISAAAAVVTNDSGLMHVAAALGRPLVAIYGSTSPGFTPPLAKSARILTPELDCSPCFERECPLGHHDCMKQTSPLKVTDALQQLQRESVSAGDGK